MITPNPADQSTETLPQLRAILASDGDAVASFENYHARVFEFDDGERTQWTLSLWKDGMPPAAYHDFETLDDLCAYLARGKVFFISATTEWSPVASESDLATLGWNPLD